MPDDASDPEVTLDDNASSLSGFVESESINESIGPYKLRELLGEGGMGSVYLAEQSEPVRRQVALKVVKAGMDSKQVVLRFEAERQALAMMDHPNIAKVFDAGATANGRPYFVMELVRGVPLTKYADKMHLSLRERLPLFVQTCHAIQHAHMKGIIHRDIKPSNVLVALHDNKPVVKVIDFGVAKAMNQKLTEETMFTQAGAIIGTLEYMSPEQAELSESGVDTRSDIYSLGVLLYELLTGTTPLDHKTQRSAAFLELLRMIREVEPPKPSTRISMHTKAAAEIAKNRSLDPARFVRLLRGELDWIAMKALEKNRNRRYETASSLARDVERYLRDEPVEACPPSVVYQAGKFVRKHKILLAAAAAMVLVMTGLAGMIGVLLYQHYQQVRVQAENEKLRNERGELTVGDPTKIWARAMITGTSLKHGFRIYIPEDMECGIYGAGKDITADSTGNNYVVGGFARKGDTLVVRVEVTRNPDGKAQAVVSVEFEKGGFGPWTGRLMLDAPHSGTEWPGKQSIWSGVPKSTSVAYSTDKPFDLVRVRSEIPQSMPPSQKPTPGLLLYFVAKPQVIQGR